MPTTNSLYSHNLLKLPIGIFMELTNANEDASVQDRFSSAKQLRLEILHKLHHSAGGPPSKRRRRWTAAQNHPNRGVSLEGDAYRNQHAHGITTVGAMLQQSPYNLVFILDPLLSLSECQTFYQRVCKHCAPLPRTAWMERTDVKIATRLSTGWSTLDRALRGGLHIGTMTELVGAAGTAKTQLALQTAITTAATPSWYREAKENQVVALNASAGGTIWIDTEQKVSLLRLQEIAMARLSNPNDVKSTLENVTVHSPSNMSEFWHIMDKTLEVDIQSRNTAAQRAVDDKEPSRSLPVRLLVIDSIAALMRREEGTTAAQQTTALLQITQQLKRFAHQYQLAIIVINQVTSASQTTNWGKPKESAIIATTPRAALGTAWHHCVTTRIELQHFPDDHRRQARVAKSVFVEPSPVPIPFQVTHQGVVDVPK